MEVNYYQDAALPENRVDVYYREQDTEITGLMEFLEAERVIVGRKDRSVKRIFLREVYYLEIVDRHCLRIWIMKFFRSNPICVCFWKSMSSVGLYRSENLWW